MELNDTEFITEFNEWIEQTKNQINNIIDKMDVFINDN